MTWFHGPVSVMDWYPLEESCAKGCVVFPVVRDLTPTDDDDE